MRVRRSPHQFSATVSLRRQRDCTPVFDGTVHRGYQRAANRSGGRRNVFVRYETVR
jgi:hypothetical protein